MYVRYELMESEKNQSFLRRVYTPAKDKELSGSGSPSIIAWSIGWTGTTIRAANCGKIHLGSDLPLLHFTGAAATTALSAAPGRFILFCRDKLQENETWFIRLVGRDERTRSKLLLGCSSSSSLFIYSSIQWVRAESAADDGHDERREKLA